MIFSSTKSPSFSLSLSSVDDFLPSSGFSSTVNWKTNACVSGTELLLLDATTEEELVWGVREDAHRSAILRLRLTWSGSEFGDIPDAVFNQLKQCVNIVINCNIMSWKDQRNSWSDFCWNFLGSVMFSESVRPVAMWNFLKFVIELLRFLVLFRPKLQLWEVEEKTESKPTLAAPVCSALASSGRNGGNTGC